MSGASQHDPEYCRQQALEMVKLAQQAPSDAVRSSYLELAANWTRLAEEAESPHRWRRAHK